MRIAFIVKGNIKNKHGFYNDATIIKQTYLFESFDIFETTQKKQAIELAQKASLTHNYLIAVGGDGTLNEVLNGIMKTDKRPILGHLQYGSANDFSRTAKLTDAKQLVNLIGKQQQKLIDIGELINSNEDGKEQKKYFINIADAGIGGHVVEKVNKSKKRMGSNFTFLKAITGSFVTYEQSEVHCIADTFTFKGKVLSVAVANGKYFGSGICIAPDAKLNDGWFNVTIIGNINMLLYATKLNKLKKGKKIEHPEIHYYKAKEIEIKPIELSCALDMDGEFAGYAPVKIKILPKAIYFLY